MTKKLVAVFLCLSILLLGMVGCSAKPSGKDTGKTEATGKKTQINISTATTAGIYYVLGNALAKVWKDKIPNINASVQSTAGSNQNVELLARGESHVAFLQNGIAADAWNGEKDFNGKPKRDFLGMVYLYPNNCYFVVRKDSGINELKDLKGKRIIPGPVGSGTEVNAREILSVVDIDYKNKKDAIANYVSNSEAAEKFADNQTDMAYIAGGIPHASVTEMMTRGDAKILEVKGEVRDSLIKKYPAYFPVEIPANSYKGQTEALQTVAQGNILVVRKDVDPQIVYEMIKNIYANKNELANSYKGAAKFDIKDGLKGMTVPLHPGAIKFFEENGVKIPDNLKP
ncbi:MAG: hypothetical protein VR68_08885 [Peptococcaceae bacterium BRH_c4a]|nr:MAG: hypothetical protein VR68_08885 [Peptococcaceae bacterium BRH_c4a]